MMHVRPSSLGAGGAWLAVALGLAAATPLVAQTGRDSVPTVDYQRAERFLGWNTEDLIAGGQVDPTWLSDGNRFWYRNNTGSGTEFVLVDPVRDTRRPAFDHARLAAAMSLADDTAYIPNKLPFRTFKFIDDESSIEFNARKKRFTCTLTSYQCTVGDTLPSESRYAISPDSTLEAFYKDYNLWIRPYKGGDSTQLTTDGVKWWSYGEGEKRPQELLHHDTLPDRPNVVWSPDSKKIAVYRQDFRGVGQMPYISYTSQRPKYFSQPYALPGDSIVPVPNIHIIDVQTKANIALKLYPTPNQLSLGGSPIDSAWTKDSQKFRFHYLTRASKSIYLAEADAQSGDVRILAMDTSKTWVETNPQGRPSWTVTSAGDVIWWSERDGWPQLWRFDAKQGVPLQQVTTTSDTESKGSAGAGAHTVAMARVGTPEPTGQITSGAWDVGDVLNVDESARQIYFTGRGHEGGNPYYARLYRVGIDGTGLTLLTPEDANHNIDFSPSGKYFIDSYSRIEQPPVTVLRAVPDGRIVRKLEEADISRLKAFGWTGAEVFTVKARDNVTDLYGIMFKPTNFDPTKKYPIIDHIYPGPQVGSVGRWAFQPGGEERAIAELGFIVIELDHLGTPLRSKAFHDNYYGNFGDNGLPDHIAGIKQLAARHPWIDIDRVGIYGHSGGGFASTDAMLRYPDFFKVAVSGSGNHDNRSYNIYWAEKYQGLLTKDPKTGKDNFEASANKTMAKNLKGHLLLMHGDMDDNVHPAMTIQLVNELIKANQDFDLIIAPDRAHGLNEPYFIRRRWDYFVRYLMGAEPPKEYEIKRPDNN